MDGNWKTNRLKCTYDNMMRKSIDFGDYRLGCPYTPDPLSYFCRDHKYQKLEFEKVDYPKKLLEEFKIVSSDNSEISNTFNTDKSKVYTCESKTSTCGLQIFCSNCGLILGFKEMFGSESCTQVAVQLTEFRKHFKGKSILLAFTFNIYKQYI